MSKKILLIDDEELITRTLAKMLERGGYEVLVAKSGKDAIVMAEEEPFDLVISDIRMPGINGVETVRILLEAKGSKRAHDLPIIFITGYADSKIEEEAKKLCPKGYILKPFEYQEVMDKVGEILKEKN